MRSLLGLLSILSVPLALGCGKSDAEKFNDAYCAEVAKCCAQAGMPADGKTCHLVMSFLASYGSYDSAAGDACLAEMQAQVSAGTFCSGSSSSADSPCDSVYGSGSSGTKQVGEKCDFDNDCAGGTEGKATCEYDFDSGVGTCKALGEVGAPCESTFDCVDSAYCDYDSDLCAARVAAGGACTLGSECLDGYYCPSGTNQCTAQKENGAACTSFSECRSSTCDGGTCKSSGLENPDVAMLCG
ncbi:MAG: hypothetical protein JXP73_08095 [Deltaproteobacteria bacterium]|nr:hypothetical protein [Deltaproteobacteria bacterium]